MLAGACARGDPRLHDRPGPLQALGASSVIGASVPSGRPMEGGRQSVNCSESHLPRQRFVAPGQLFIRLQLKELQDWAC